MSRTRTNRLFRRTSTLQNPIVTLGISAIDVLCCSLVGGLVLFLIVSEQGTNRETLYEGGDNKDMVIMLLYKTNPSQQTLRVRVAPPSDPSASGGGESGPSEFWSDSQNAKREIPGMLQAGGGAFWFIPNSNEAGSDDNVAVLHLRRPMTGQWTFSVAYVDSKDGLAGVPPPSVDLIVRVFGGSTAECSMPVPLDSILEVDAAGRFLMNGATFTPPACEGQMATALNVGP
jgi:hypothetical protein